MKYKAKALCTYHYNLQWHQSFKGKTCSFDGCNRPRISPLHCSGHRTQWSHGKELAPITKAPRGAGNVASNGYRRHQVNGKLKLEHRIVMERMLGRPLCKGEEVHHINGNKLDNRPENLELWLKSQPSGVRMRDYLRQDHDDEDWRLP